MYQTQGELIASLQTNLAQNNSILQHSPSEIATATPLALEPTRCTTCVTETSQNTIPATEAVSNKRVFETQIRKTPKRVKREGSGHVE